jgi:hypothetical protein
VSLLKLILGYSCHLNTIAETVDPEKKESAGDTIGRLEGKKSVPF